MWVIKCNHCIKYFEHDCAKVHEAGIAICTRCKNEMRYEDCEIYTLIPSMQEQSKCPNCGSTDTVMGGNDNQRDCSFWLKCHNCGVSTQEKEHTGKKFDKNKPRWDLIPWNQMRKVVHIMTGGAIKYEDDDWQHVPEAKRRYFRAALGHITDWWCDGNTPDKDSNTTHLAHAVCCLLILMWFDDEKDKSDQAIIDSVTHPEELNP